MMPVTITQNKRLVKLFALLAVVIFVLSIAAIPVSAEGSTYNITITVSGNGTVTLNSVNVTNKTVVVAAGDSPTFVMVPGASCVVEEIWVDGSSIDPAAEYTFDNISADHTLDVAFTSSGDVCVLPPDDTSDDTSDDTPTPTRKNTNWWDLLVRYYTENTPTTTTTTTTTTTATTPIITTTEVVPETTPTTTPVPETTANPETSTVTPVAAVQTTIPVTTISVEEQNTPVVPTVTPTSGSTPAESSGSFSWPLFGILGAVIVLAIIGIIMFIRVRK